MAKSAPPRPLTQDAGGGPAGQLRQAGLSWREPTDQVGVAEAEKKTGIDVVVDGGMKVW